jgi:hypothetical protein
MDTIQSQDIKSLIDIIFSKPPKPPCTYTLMLPETVVVNQVVMFQLLMSFLIAGAKHLYGNQITPEQISEKQFEELKDYIESVGYMIRYNYKYPTNNNLSPFEQPRIINIWFEKYIQKIDCHGRKIHY